MYIVYNYLPTEAGRETTSGVHDSYCKYWKWGLYSSEGYMELRKVVEAAARGAL